MVKMYLLTLLITTLTILLVGLLINFCRKRLAKTPHGLSGMCHQTGGEMCSSCGGNAGNGKEKTEKKERLRINRKSDCGRLARNRQEWCRKPNRSYPS